MRRGYLVPRGCAGLRSTCPEGALGRSAPERKAPGLRPGGGEEVRLGRSSLPWPALATPATSPDPQPLSHFPNFGFYGLLLLGALPSPERVAVWGPLLSPLPSGGHGLSPRNPADRTAASPMLLATLEAVDESLWGILLNFSNRVSSDLMPPV